MRGKAFLSLTRTLDAFNCVFVLHCIVGNIRCVLVLQTSPKYCAASLNETESRDPTSDSRDVLSRPACVGICRIKPLAVPAPAGYNCF
jgi:hypothetical protein